MVFHVWDGGFIFSLSHLYVFVDAVLNRPKAKYTQGICNLKWKGSDIISIARNIPT